MNILRLIPERGGEPTNITGERVGIGREPSSEIHLRDASVSRLHAEICKQGDEWVVTDLNSSNGVFVDRARTAHSVLLPGQRLQFGNVAFRVEIDRGDDGATVILGRSPFAATDSTLIQARRLPPAPPPAARSAVSPALLLLVGGLAVFAVSLFVAGYLRSARRPPVIPAPEAPRVARVITPPAPSPTLIPATPPPPPPLDPGRLRPKAHS